MTDPHPPLRAVLLDVDGTLIDSADLVAHSLAHASAAVGAPVRSHAEYLALVGRPVAVQAAIVAPDRQEEFVAAAIRYYEEHPEEEQPFPRGLETIAALRAMGLAVALVTSKLRRELDPVLGRCPALAAVDAIVTADTTRRPKPAPHPVLKALERLGVAPEEALFVGDSPYDLAAGRAAGVRTAAALWGPHPRERLAPEQPTYWLTDLADLLPLVRTLMQPP